MDDGKETKRLPTHLEDERGDEFGVNVVGLSDVAFDRANSMAAMSLSTARGASSRATMPPKTEIKKSTKFLLTLFKKKEVIRQRYE
jgi:hypothetical protein